MLLLVIFATHSACRKDPYNASPVDPRLPELSAEAENIAGAFIDGNAWIAEKPLYRYLPQFSICTRPGSVGTRIIISNGYQVSDDTLVRCDVGFFLRDVSIMQNFQLLDLNDTVITLDGMTNYGMLILYGDTPDTLKFGDWQIVCT